MADNRIVAKAVVIEVLLGATRLLMREKSTKVLKEVYLSSVAKTMVKSLGNWSFLADNNIGLLYSPPQGFVRVFRGSLTKWGEKIDDVEGYSAKELVDLSSAGDMMSAVPFHVLFSNVKKLSLPTILTSTSVTIGLFYATRKPPGSRGSLVTSVLTDFHQFDTHERVVRLASSFRENKS